MPADKTPATYSSFLGTGWKFPPEFSLEAGQALTSADEQDIDESLRILFGTARGERFLNPSYGLDTQELLFEPMSTSMRTFLKDRIKIAILVHEPRIEVLTLEVDSPDPNTGVLRILLEYQVRATNSRFNLVYPFYWHDSNELVASVGVPGF
jgi:phage baseplate assembly protein W